TQDRAKSGGTAVFDMLDARRQLAPPPLLLDPPLLFLMLEALVRLCSSENREPHCDVARHGLEPLDLRVAEAATRCRSPRDIDLLEFKRELTGRVVIPFGKARPVEEYVAPRIAPCRPVT